MDLWDAGRMKFLGGRIRLAGGRLPIRGLKLQKCGDLQFFFCIFVNLIVEIRLRFDLLVWKLRNCDALQTKSKNFKMTTSYKFRYIWNSNYIIGYNK